jgi:hemerythrin
MELYMLFLWKKSYEIGLPDVDAQHRQLVSMINELSDAMMNQQGYRVVDQILDELTNYLHLHFETEENAMREHSYPGLYKHSKLHLDLTREVLKLRENARAGQEVKAKDLLDFLCSWLKNHILVEDKGFGDFMHRVNSGRKESV